MKNIRLNHHSELNIATANIFNSYLLREWEFAGIPFAFYTINEETNIGLIMETIRSLSTLHDHILIWPSVHLLPYVSPLILARNSLESNVSFSFYINTVQGYQGCFESFLPLLNSNDYFVFNSKFSRTFFLDSVSSSVPVNAKVQPVRIPISKAILISHPRKYFVVLSRCIFSKLLHLIIESVAKCKDAPKVIKFCLLLGGHKFEEYYLEYLKALSYSLGVKLLLEYNVGDELKLDIFSEAFACISLSSTFEETQGKTLIESVSSGCLAVANNWNGFREYCHPDLLISTNWSEKEGIMIDQDQLSHGLDYTFNLYKDSPDYYMKLCKSLADQFFTKTLTSYPVIHYCTNKFKHPIRYEPLVTSFAHLPKSIEINVKTALMSTNSIDVYIVVRTRMMVSGTSLGQMLFHDYQFLRRSTATFTWPMLLHSISNDCLSRPDWCLLDLKHIYDLLIKQDIYPDWTFHIASIFGIN